MGYSPAFQITASLLAATVLTSCAGGGGGGSAPVTSPPPPAVSPPPPPASLPPLSGPTAGFPATSSGEYTRGWAVADTRAIAAWEDGYTGDGVLVAVIDDGVDAFDAELSGRISQASKDIRASRNVLFDSGNTHGTELSAIIAGKFNASTTVGLAFNATILGVRADDGTGSFSSTDLAAALDYARAQGAKVVNFSLGSSSPTSSTFQNAIQAATAAGMIVVTSAGNDGAADPNYPGQLALNGSVSNGIIVNVGAHDRFGSIVGFSNRAGNARNFYLTAPGLEIIVPDFGASGPTDPAFQTCFGDDTCEVQGTSYAAPYVTAAIALLLDAFPGLTPQQIVSLLYSSADDAGAAGIDTVYGQGRLNLAAAFAPASVVSAPIVPNGAEVPLTAPLGTVGAAFGDGLTAEAGAWQTVGFDSYDRAFSVDLAANWSRAGRTLGTGAPLLWSEAAAAPGTRIAIAENTDAAFDGASALLGEDAFVPLAARIESDLGRGLSIAATTGTDILGEASPAGLGGHFSSTGNDFGAAMTQRLSARTALTLAAQTGSVDLPGAYGVSERTAAAVRISTWRDGIGASLAVGSVMDDGSVLGLAWSDAVSRPAVAETGFLHAAMTWDAPFSAWPMLRFGVEGEVGRTEVEGGWLAFDEPLMTSAFGAGASLDWMPRTLAEAFPALGGRITVRAAQPLRVEDGRVSVSLPTATAYGRQSLGYETRSFQPVPTGREIKLSAAYEIWDGGRIAARAGISLAHEPGHVADAAPAAAAEFGLRMRF